MTIIKTIVSGIESGSITKAVNYNGSMGRIRRKSRMDTNNIY